MTDQPLTRKQQALATRERILVAASDEFQRHGYAGARLDRIAESARSNKRLIYAHFTDKAALFEAVVTRNLVSVVEAVPFDARDLPGYAERLFDHWQSHPAAMRLFLWRNLERSATTAVEEDAYARFIDQIAEQRERDNDDRALPPAHLFAFVLAILLAWIVPSPALVGDVHGEDIGERRRSVRRAVELLESSEASRG